MEERFDRRRGYWSLGVFGSGKRGVVIGRKRGVVRDLRKAQKLFVYTQAELKKKKEQLTCI